MRHKHCLRAMRRCQNAPMDILFWWLIAAVAVVGAVWIVGRSRRMRRQAMRREAAAMEALQAGVLTQTPAAQGEVIDTEELAPAPAPRPAPPPPPPAPARQWPVPPAPDSDVISQILTDEKDLPPLRSSGRAQQTAQSLAGAELRQIVLAWFEARGYVMKPVPPTAFPIEGVLTHRDNASRSYAFLVQPDIVTQERITALLERARELGHPRVALVAEGGAEAAVRDTARRRHVRLIDRRVMEAELAELPRETATRIIAVARARTA
ncbi:MAG: hypothetical protein RL669_480 [Pseudomonadota bacterium]|jgi:hypothetical protein